MDKEVFNAVDVLIERMQSNPEDFDVRGRFYAIAEALTDMALGAKLVSEHLWMLTDQEKICLLNAYRALCRKNFQETIYNKLFEDAPAQSTRPTQLLSPAHITEQALTLLNKELGTNRDQEYYVYNTNNIKPKSF